MRHVLGLRCINCGKEFEATPLSYTCSDCGSKDGILDVVYNYKAMGVTRQQLAGSRDYSIFRYLDFLPIKPSSPRPHLRVGWTPLYRPQGLARHFSFPGLYIKDDGQNPTASLKDRASIIAVIKAWEAGMTTIACASTGNAASSLAGNAAALGLSSYIFVPERAPQGKLAQLLVFGAKVISVQGSYEEAFRLSTEAIKRWGWYNRNAAINPYLVEGKKTVALEIAEQLDWEVPQWVVVSVGDGCTLAGVWQGFKDLYQAGLIDRLPKIAGVQSTGCAPLAKAWGEGSAWQPAQENTLADSIAVGVPRNPVKALRAVKESGGCMLAVKDEEILAAMRLLGRSSGVFAEPAAAAGLAGFRHILEAELISTSDKVVVICTGNGLKDVNNALAAVGAPLKVKPDLAELTRKLAERGLGGN